MIRGTFVLSLCLVVGILPCAHAAEAPAAPTTVTLSNSITASPDSLAPGDTFRLILSDTDPALAGTLKHLPRALILTEADAGESLKSQVAFVGNDTYRLKPTVAPGTYTVGYVWVDGRKADARRYLATTQLRVRPALSVSIVPEPDRGRSLTLAITNGSARAKTVEARVDMIGTRTDTISTIMLDPHQTRAMPITRVMAADAPLSQPLPVSVAITPGDASWNGNVYFWSAGRNTPGPPLTLDSAQDWLSQDGTWNGPDDLSATVTARYSADRLMLRADVTDDVFSNSHSGADIAHGDSIQIAVDPGWSRRPDATQAVEIGLALTPEGPRVYRWTIPAGPMPGATLSVTREGSHTIYDASLPWSELGVADLTPPRTIGFSLVVNDDDGEGVKGRLEYGGGISREKRADRYAALTLTK